MVQNDREKEQSDYWNGWKHEIEFQLCFLLSFMLMQFIGYGSASFHLEVVKVKDNGPEECSWSDACRCETKTQFCKSSLFFTLMKS